MARLECFLKVVGFRFLGMWFCISDVDEPGEVFHAKAHSVSSAERLASRKCWTFFHGESGSSAGPSFPGQAKGICIVVGEFLRALFRGSAAPSRRL